MNIFILTSGRTGSAGFIKACKYINNYSASHESLFKSEVEYRFNYPMNHIESDNRLSWFLGRLDMDFGNKALYVHLKRNEALVAQSFNNRWFGKNSIIRGFAWNICGLKWLFKTKKERLRISEFYVKTIDENINLFLKDKENVLIMELENIQSDFTKFWNFIGATGDLNKALLSFSSITNKRRWYNI